MLNRLIWCCLGAGLFIACGGLPLGPENQTNSSTNPPQDEVVENNETPEDPNEEQNKPAVPGAELGTGDRSPSSVTLTLIAGANHGLKRPRDLAFNPMRPDELWIVSAEDDSVLIITDASKPTRKHERRKDGYAMHFMDNPSSIAFGAEPTTFGKSGTFGTCQESRNTYDGHATHNDFMGPALWSSDLSIFAKLDPFGLGSHIDMLHGSPDCMGIAHEIDNVYWVFGGKAHTGTTMAQKHTPVPAIVRYDFGADHGVGADDHADGQIHQYVTHQVKRVPGVPSHLEYRAANKMLYIADTGNARVAKLDTTSGTKGAALQGQEPLRGYYMMEGASLTDVVPASSGLVQQPSGLEIKNDLLYVSDNANGRITAFTLEGESVNHLNTGLGAGALAGMAFGPDGRLYFVDMESDRVFRIDPK